MGKFWLCLTVDVAFAAVVGAVITGSPMTALRVLAVGAGIAIAMVLGTGLHELAHTVVGHRRGLRILVVAIWPVVISRGGGRLRVGLMPGIPKLGGFVLFDLWEKPASVLAPAM